MSRPDSYFRTLALPKEPSWETKEKVRVAMARSDRGLCPLCGGAEINEDGRCVGECAGEAVQGETDVMRFHTGLPCASGYHPDHSVLVVVRIETYERECHLREVRLTRGARSRRIRLAAHVERDLELLADEEYRRDLDDRRAEARDPERH